MKKWLALLLSSCLMLVSAAGCTLSDVQTLAINSPKEVTDAKGETDQTIACGDLLFQTSDGFVYEKATETEALNTVTEVTYWRYYRDSGKKVELGTLTNVSGANTTGTVVEDTLYVIEGGCDEGESRGYDSLAAIHLTDNTVEIVPDLPENSFYTQVCDFGSRLLLVRMDKKGTYLDVYDPETGKVENLLTESYSEEGSLVAKRTISRVTTWNGHVGVLIKERGENDSWKLWLDVYTDKMKPVQHLDVSEVSGDCYGSGLSQDATQFEMDDNMFYFEGQSVFFGSIKDGDLQRRLLTPGSFRMAEETTRNEQYDLFYRTCREKPELILLNRETGEITSVELPAWEEPYWVNQVYFNDKGQVMLFLIGYEDGLRLPVKLIERDLNELGLLEK